MNISPINSINIVKMNSFLGTKKDISEEPTEFEAKLPNPKDYDYEPLFTPPDKADELTTEYKSKLTDVFFDKDGKLNPTMKKHLDDSVFVFTLNGGAPKAMTIKDALKESIRGEKHVDCNLIHGTLTVEVADKIIKEGFDPKYISRTDLGPGFYFAFSEDSAMNYGSAKLTAKCEGRCALVNKSFYKDIANNTVMNSIKNFGGLKSNGYATSSIENEICSRIINEYARTILCEDMGFDFGMGTNGQVNALVAYNPDAISEIRHC